MHVWPDVPPPETLAGSQVARRWRCQAVADVRHFAVARAARSAFVEPVVPSHTARIRMPGSTSRSPYGRGFGPLGARSPVAAIRTRGRAWSTAATR